jgi:hypothetical protein
MWTCPKCGRSFQNPRQSHACQPSLTLAEGFSGKKAVWRPLYERIYTEFSDLALPFDVHVTKSAVYWRHDSAFAGFLPKVKLLELEFCRDGFDSAVPTLRHMEMSPHRVSHYIAVTQDSDFAAIRQWLSESYAMTKSKREREVRG